MSLPDILRITETYLEAIRAGRYAEIESDIAQCRGLLEDYLHIHQITALTERQQTLLQRIAMNHQQAVELVENRKMALAGHISRLQQGKKLGKTYCD